MWPSGALSESIQQNGGSSSGEGGGGVNVAGEEGLSSLVGRGGGG